MVEFLHEAVGFTKDQRVRILVETLGDDHEGNEHKLPAGSVANIFAIKKLPAPQGLTFILWIPVDEVNERGIVNVFDEGDGPISNFMEAL